MHRDIKPENILVHKGENGELTLKLTDFGFASFFDPSTGLQQVLGSPLYMAPELVREQSYTERVDVWSVGVVAFVLLTGKPPFFGKSKSAIKHSILEGEADFGLTQANLSVFATQFVNQCLQKDPEKRPSMKELVTHPWLDLPESHGPIDPLQAEEFHKNLTIFT